MIIITGFFWVIVGVIFIYLGSFQIIGAMLPHDYAIKFAEVHGAWVRENVFHLPPHKEGK